MREYMFEGKLRTIEQVHLEFYPNMPRKRVDYLLRVSGALDRKGIVDYLSQPVKNSPRGGKTYVIARRAAERITGEKGCAYCGLYKKDTRKIGRKRICQTCDASRSGVVK